MPAEEETEVQEGENVELNASGAGDADQTYVTDQLDNGDEEQEDENGDEDDEMTSVHRTQDASMATDEDETTVKSNNDASSQDEEEEDVEEDQDEEDEGNDALKTPKDKPIKAEHTKSSGKKGRVPSVVGLTIPFRTVKKAMKLDPDTPIVQNEAAVMLTYASELFLKKLAKRSLRNAKNRGRSTIRYEDIAEARTNDPALSFLEMLLP